MVGGPFSRPRAVPPPPPTTREEIERRYAEWQAAGMHRIPQLSGPDITLDDWRARQLEKLAESETAPAGNTTRNEPGAPG
jgi:hypothetical protein